MRKALGFLGLLSSMFVFGACATEAGDAPAGGEPSSASDPGKGDINGLVASAGKMDTTKKADDQPVLVEQKSPVEMSSAGQSFKCTQDRYSLTKVPEKFVALNPNADVLWPGSLVQGKSMSGGILDPVPVERAPGTITLTLASGGGGPFFKKMESPSLSAAVQAQNEILAAYTGATPAKFSYSYESIYSQKQLAVAVDANVEGTNWSGSASLSVSTSDTKSRFLIQFTQEYFTMAFDPPKGAAGAFAPSVTAGDLRAYVGEGNPPVYVASVTYGRIFYMLFESSASQLDLEAAVKGSYSGGALTATASAKASYKKVINESTVKSYGLGGNAADAIDAASGGAPDQFEKIRKFLVGSANFSKDNPGVPISYTIRYLGDASQVKLALTTEYTAKNCSAICQAGTDKVLDACGVCGGNGSTCAGCAANMVGARISSGSFVEFHADKADHGDIVTFPAGSYTMNYAFLSYSHVWWSEHQFKCSGGSWQKLSGSVYGNGMNDTSDSNASWSSGSGDFIAAGWRQ